MESKESDDTTYRFQTAIAAGQRGEFMVVENENHDWVTIDNTAIEGERHTQGLRTAFKLKDLGSLHHVSH